MDNLYARIIHTNFPRILCVNEPDSTILGPVYFSDSLVPDIYKCELCRVIYSDQLKLIEHYRKHHALPKFGEHLLQHILHNKALQVQSQGQGHIKGQQILHNNVLALCTHQTTGSSKSPKTRGQGQTQRRGHIQGQGHTQGQGQNLTKGTGRKTEPNNVLVSAPKMMTSGSTKIGTPSQKYAKVVKMSNSKGMPRTKSPNHHSNPVTMVTVAGDMRREKVVVYSADQSRSEVRHVYITRTKPSRVQVQHNVQKVNVTSSVTSTNVTSSEDAAETQDKVHVNDKSTAQQRQKTSKIESVNLEEDIVTSDEDDFIFILKNVTSKSKNRWFSYDKLNLRCFYCQFETLTKSSLVKHMKSYHGNLVGIHRTVDVKEIDDEVFSNEGKL